MTTASVHGHCIVDRFGEVWTSQNRCKALFFLNRESHAVQIWPTPKTYVQFSNRTSLETLRPSEVVETAFRHASIGIRCEPVWSATFLPRTSTGHKLLESSRLAELECEISPGEDVRQKITAFKNSGMKAVWAAGLGPTQERCELPLFFAEFGQAIRGWKALDLGSLNMQFQQDWPKDKKLQLF